VAIADGQQAVLDPRLREGEVLDERPQPAARSTRQHLLHRRQVEQAQELRFAQGTHELVVLDLAGEVGERPRGDVTGMPARTHTSGGATRGRWMAMSGCWRPLRPGIVTSGRGPSPSRIAHREAALRWLSMASLPQASTAASQRASRRGDRCPTA